MSSAAGPWPRHARLWSVLILVVGAAVGVGGVLAALGRSTTEGLIAVGGAVAIAVLGVVTMAWGISRWAGGEPAYPSWVALASFGITLVVCLLASSDLAGPAGVSMIGGGMVGLMVGNIRAISRYGG